MENVGPLGMLAGAGSVLSVVVALFAGWKTYEKIAAKNYGGAAAFFVRFAIAALVAYGFLGFTFGFFPTALLKQ